MLDTLGGELGLRIRDAQPTNEMLIVDCLTEEIQQRALRLDGLQVIGRLGQTGIVSVVAVQNNPLNLSEVLKLVDSECCVEQEMARLGPQGNAPQQP